MAASLHWEVRRVFSIKEATMGAKKEGKDIRDPFGVAVQEGHLSGWDGAVVLRGVDLDPREGGSSGFHSEADLVLVKPGVGIAIVECKRKASSAAKHGMVEQVLMYGEMANELLQHGKDRLAARLISSKPGKGCAAPDSDAIERTVNGMSGRTDIHHLVVLDRWGSHHLPQTVGLTLRMLNRALPPAGVPPVQVFTIKDGAIEGVRIE